MSKLKAFALVVMALGLTGAATAADLMRVYKSLSPDKQAQIRALNTQRKNDLLKAYQARVASIQGRAGDASAMSTARSGFKADRQSVNQKYLLQAKEIVNGK